MFSTTRGAITSENGWLSVFSLDADGLFSEKEEYYATPTSGGKANAIDLLPKYLQGTTPQKQGLPGSQSGFWILLTDDDDWTAKRGGGVHVLEWDGWDSGGVQYVAGSPVCEDEVKSESEESEEQMAGGSHAIWLD